MRAVLCNRPGSNSHKAALHFDWPTLFCIDNPDLSQVEFLIVVIANHGDEELQPEMESFLVECPRENLSFALCELGNYFGFEDEFFGCKKEALRLLGEKSWVCLAHTSVDSYPNLDDEKIALWSKEMVKLADNHIAK